MSKNIFLKCKESIYVFLGGKLKELPMPCIDSECTQFAVLFHFVLLSVYMWSVPIVSGTLVLFKIGSLHLLFCPISCHTRGAKQKRFA